MPSIEFNYVVVKGLPLINDGNNLKMSADFGYATYKGVVYNAQEIVVLSPSEHTVMNRVSVSSGRRVPSTQWSSR